jgi:hypothetical protein
MTEGSPPGANSRMATPASLRRALASIVADLTTASDELDSGELHAAEMTASRRLLSEIGSHASVVGGNARANTEVRLST